ncbi:MAG: MlaA family lipoprotein [Methylomicrobium sp.]|jgi:phospholipid-binding lipoprotein MlaA
MFQNKFILNSALLANLVVGGLLSGCASDPAQPAKDEWEGWNRSVHGFNDDLDKAIIKPVAKGYQEYVPEPVNQGVTNFFGNINDIGITLNDFFQLKMLQGGMDLGRFLINTTAGVGGLFDVASKLDLPKHNEDFGQTLGFWGVPSGNYLVLPLLGPSSPRDAAGLLGDALLNPLTYISFGSSAAVSAAITGAKAVEVTDMRADLLSSEKIVDEASVDRYDFIKNAYLQNREYQVYDGNPPEQNLEDFDLEEVMTDSAKQDKTQATTPSAANPELPPVTQGADDLGRTNDNSGPAPVVNRSRRLLELMPPE